MDKGSLAERKNRYLLISLAICAVLVNIKSIFTDYNYDVGYAVAMAYRMVRGDRMFLEMWEPHQTSAFLCAWLIKLYLMLTGTLTGIVLFLQAAGMSIRILVVLFFYYSMKRLIGAEVLGLMCLFFLGTSPKGLPMPEFSNMQLWFSVGIFCCLVRYLQRQEQKLWLVAVSIFLCLEVLAYPSALIVYPGILFILYRHAESRGKDIFVLSSVCLCFGMVYGGYFVLRRGWWEVVKSISYIIVEDASHNSTLVDKCRAYLQECGEILLGLTLLGLVSFLLTGVFSSLIYYYSKKQIKIYAKSYWLIVFFLLFLICDVVQALKVEMSYAERLPIYVPVIILSLRSLKQCRKTEQQIVECGIIISFLSFFATLLLTNLTVVASLNYLILAVMVAFLPIMNRIEQLTVGRKKNLGYSLIVLFCAITLFRSGYIMKCMSTEKTNVLNIAGVVKAGPAKGLVSEYLGPQILNVTLEEWHEYVEPGDRVLVVGAGLYDPLLYLYEEVEISTTSTICTPTYDKMLLEYWEKYPEKYPNVVIVDCWFGELRVKKNNWIMQWLESEFEPGGYVDGSYWRYYRR